MGRNRKNQDGDASDSKALADEPDAPLKINPYDVLGITKEASADEVKTAYRKAALKHHPDKVSDQEKDAAHVKFQEIAFAYAILSDSRRRSRYDTTSRTEETMDLDDDDFNWTDFFRTQFKEVVTFEAIENFKTKYKGSEEERLAIIDAFRKGQGKMKNVYQKVLLSDWEEDDDRFRQIINDEIDAGLLKGFKKLEPLTEKEKMARRKSMGRGGKEEAEARQAARDMGLEGEILGKDKSTARSSKAGKKSNNGKVGGEDALAALIQKRQAAREEDFFAKLESKYAPKGKKDKSKMDEPPEEAFERNRNARKRSIEEIQADEDKRTGYKKGKQRRRVVHED